MEDVRIYDTDNYLEMAEKIFFHFKVNQSCTVKGFVHDGDDLFAKGELVVKQLEAFDKKQNVGSGNRRKRFKPENSIGDFVAQKMFRWDKRTADHKIIFSIWRMQ